MKEVTVLNSTYVRWLGELIAILEAGGHVTLHSEESLLYLYWSEGFTIAKAIIACKSGHRFS
jgi:hypothetical protein